MKGRIEGVIFFLFFILNAESRIEYPGKGGIEIRVKRKIGARQTPSVSTQGEGIDPSPFNAKNRSFFPAHCSRFAFCSRRSSIRLAVATTPAMGTISRWTMISVSRIFLLLSLSPSLLLPLLHTSHGLLRARYHGRSVAVWSIGHVISIKNRWQRNRWCIDSNDPPSDSNYFSFYSFLSLSLSRFTHNVTPAEFIFSTRSTLRSTGIELRGRVMTFRLLQIHYNYRGDSSFDGNLLEILGRYSWNVTWDKLNAKKKKKKQGKKRKEGRE